jgi:hypothetical protein
MPIHQALFLIYLIGDILWKNKMLLAIFIRLLIL